MRTLGRKWVAAAIVVLAVAGAGAAVAATGTGTPREESKAIIDDAAKQLGVDSAKLSDALEQAMANRVDAAVAAGKLTKEEGEALKERIQAGDLPLVGVGGRGHHGHRKHGHGPLGGRIDAAAEYLGMTEAALRAELEGGKSLADVAAAKGKSVDGLVAALTTAAKAKLDGAVESGKLTRAQADEMLAELGERLRELVNGTFPGPPPGFEKHRFGGDGTVCFRQPPASEPA